MLRPSQGVIILILASSLLVSLLPGLPVDAQTTDTQDLQLGKVEEAMARAQEHLLAVQDEDGCWDGNSLSPTDMTAMYVLLLDRLGVNNESKQRAVEYLINSQRPDGSWSNISNCLTVLALEQAGLSPTSPTLQRAYEYIRQQEEPLEDQSFYIQIHYALAGKYPWQRVNLPFFDDTDANDTGGFFAKRPNANRRDTAFALFILMTLHAEDGPSQEQRELQLMRAESLLLQRQLSDGSWFNSSLIPMYVLNALYELGYDTNDEPIVRGLRYLETLQYEDGAIAIFKLPIFDTSIALLALEASGFEMDSREVQRAVQWLVDSRNLVGEWGWTPESGLTSDVDDTAFAIAALLNHEQTVTEEVMPFLLSRQNEDGGWASFEPDFTDLRDVKWIPLDSEIHYLGDPSIPDATAHALLALGRAGYTVEDESIGRAVSYLQRVQFDNGMWFAWWGIPYIYGTSAVLVGLEAVDADMEAPYVQKAVEWLKSYQNTDGGWGEDSKARERPEYAGKGDSTSSQTAWAILGLLAAHVSPDSEAIKNGISYLLSHQKDDGSWEPAYTLMASAPVLYSLEHAETSWPLWALSSYSSAIKGSRGDTETPGYRIIVPLVVVIISLSLLGLCTIIRRNLLRKPKPPANS